LPFPEGTACAQVLIAGDRGRAAARPVFMGMLIGAAYQFAMRGLQLWRETVFVSISALHKMSFGAELTPIFLGVGYLIGSRIAAVMLCGGLLAWAVLIPAFDLIGGTSVGTLLGVPQVTDLDAWEIWRRYVRFVGAGGVACGGAISIVRVLPVMIQSFRQSLAGWRVGDAAGRVRTERDLPPIVVLGGTILLALALWLTPAFDMHLVSALLAVGFSYFFVIVSARMVGLIGSTSQPVSGMTITALLGTAFTLHALGYQGQTGMAASLSVAVIVCTAIALAGDISQDLKCGALVGATPRALQLGEMIGVIAAAVRAGWVLYLLHAAYTIGSETLPAPQAKLMATLAQGVMEGNLPWGLLFLGAGLAAVAELFGLTSLAFAIGLYLPVTTTTPLILGGLLARRHRRRTDTNEPATLLASGLIAGDALTGIAIAALVVMGWDRHLALRTPGQHVSEMWATLVPFALLAVLLLRQHPVPSTKERA
jgi:putative OPT family oligopeptide transporter